MSARRRVLADGSVVAASPQPKRSRTLRAAAVAIIALPMAALWRPSAATSLDSLQVACGTDFAKFCTSRGQDAAIQPACLRQNWMSLSPQCQHALRPPSNASSEGDPSNDE